MVLLIGESRSFTFHVLARSRSEARNALRMAWKVHVEQTGATARRFEDAVDINFINDIRPERVYRDHSHLKVKGD